MTSATAESTVNAFPQHNMIHGFYRKCKPKTKHNIPSELFTSTTSTTDTTAITNINEDDD